jgi:hypothetical protein
MKLDFISQPSSKSTLPFAGLQHMQQCQVDFHLIFASMLWSKWMVHEKWSPQWGFEPSTSQSSALTTRPRLLACLTIKFPLPNITQLGKGNCWSVVKQDTSWIFNISWFDVWQIGRRSYWYLATVSFLFCGIKRIN